MPKQSESKKNKKKFLIMVSIAVLVAAIVFYLVWYPLEHTMLMFVRSLCDGFFVSGMLYAAIGVFTGAAAAGMFDIFGYAAKKIAESFKRGEKKKGLSFDAYRAEQKKKERKPLTMLLYIGLCFIVISLILMVIYLIMRG